MALCGSQNCGCAISSSTLDISGSGTEASPWVIDLFGVVGTANVEVFTSGGSWVKPSGLAFITVEVQGAGGGSGGCAATGASQAAAGGGGGGGGYARRTILAADLAASETVTVGAGGTAGAAGENDGGTGGSSSFGAFCTANGGVGGTGGTAVAAPQLSPNNGGAGGTATGGDINIQGANGNAAAFYTNRIRRALGGSSMLGTSGDDNQTSAGAAGIVGHTYGGGASGSMNAQSQGTARAGGAGGAGIVIVTEYLTGA